MGRPMKANPQEAKRLYLEEKLSVSEVAGRLGVCHTTVSSYLEELEVQTRTASEIQQARRWAPGQRAIALSEAKKLYLEEGLSIWEVCERLGITDRTFRKFLAELGIKRRTRSESMKIKWEDPEFQAKVETGIMKGRGI